jgi:SAM-dependent methyltransferase
MAWDCACGSGQASGSLTSHFDWVVGTDASLEQVAAAETDERARFAVAVSEQVPLSGHSVDIITVAQALHWFANGTFFAEVRRVVRPGGILAAWTYGMPQCVLDDVGRVVHEFIDGPLGPYWPPQVKMVLNSYTSIELPFSEIQAPAFELDAEWPLDLFLGFARTWSAARRYSEERGEDPVLELGANLERLRGGRRELLPIKYRLDLRVCRV